MVLKSFPQLITFILPTFNEVENISFVIDKLINYPKKFEIEIIVVDDGSTDGTASLVRELSKKERRIRIINRHNRYGLSSAIKEGCLCAAGDVIAVMDSDGQHEVKNIFEAINLLIKMRLNYWESFFK